MTTFYIVAFTDEEGAVTIVPSNWMLRNNESCYWPSDTTGIVIKKAPEPDPINWLKVNCRVLKQFGKFFFKFLLTKIYLLLKNDVLLGLILVCLFQVRIK
jgi:hypothetical protein